MANPIEPQDETYTCQTCGNQYVYPNNRNLCEPCFDEYRDEYVRQLSHAINSWLMNNPPPMHSCVYCGKPVIAFRIRIDKFNPYGNGCETCFNEMTAEMTVKANRRSLEISKRPKAKTLGYVYFASNDRLIKIGHTTRLDKRMDVLGIEPIHHLQIVDYRKLERWFHDYFSKSRVKGEWFDLHPDEIEWIKELESDGATITDSMSHVIWSADNA